MSVGILTLSIHLPNCHSLKEKRGQIKPIIHRLHKEFNISVAESDHQDLWGSCKLLIACAGSQGAPIQATLTKVVTFYESHFPDLPITNEKIEIII